MVVCEFGAELPFQLCLAVLQYSPRPWKVIDECLLCCWFPFVPMEDPSMKDCDFSYQYITAIVIIKEIQIDLAAISQFCC